MLPTILDILATKWTKESLKSPSNLFGYHTCAYRYLFVLVIFHRCFWQSLILRYVLDIFIRCSCQIRLSCFIKLWYSLYRLYLTRTWGHKYADTCWSRIRYDNLFRTTKERPWFCIRARSSVKELFLSVAIRKNYYLSDFCVYTEYNDPKYYTLIYDNYSKWLNEIHDNN